MGIRTLGIVLLGVLGVTGQALGGTSSLSLEDKISIARTRCEPPTKASPVLYRNDVRTDIMQTFEEMSELYKVTYNSERRLEHRVGFNIDSRSFVSSNGRDSVTYPEHFIKTITLHIENALKKKYANFIFFPDMGHSHFFIPLDYYEQSMAGTKGGALASINKMLRDRPEGLKTLYHTAEHLKTLDSNRNVLPDRFIQWRFYTRNPVFDEVGNSEIITNFEESQANTAHKLDGHRDYAGYNISANKDGCFPFEDVNGEIQYFDISAWDLRTDCTRVNCGDE